MVSHTPYSIQHTANFIRRQQTSYRTPTPKQQRTNNSVSMWHYKYVSYVRSNMITIIYIYKPRSTSVWQIMFTRLTSRQALKNTSFLVKALLWGVFSFTHHHDGIPYFLERARRAVLVTVVGFIQAWLIVPVRVTQKPQTYQKSRYHKVPTLRIIYAKSVFNF